MTLLAPLRKGSRTRSNLSRFEYLGQQTLGEEDEERKKERKKKAEQGNLRWAWRQSTGKSQGKSRAHFLQEISIRIQFHVR
jgi:hypothetical protein